MNFQNSFKMRKKRLTLQLRLAGIDEGCRIGLVDKITLNGLSSGSK